MKEVIVNSVSEYIDYFENHPNVRNYWFRGVASPEYLPVPGLVWRKARRVESALEHGFLTHYKSYITQNDLDSWEIYSLMQHHGLPTRLLDWTESALVALFFALSSDPELDSDRIVWVLNPFELNEKSLGDARLFCPSIIKDADSLKFNFEGQNIDINSYLPPNLKPELKVLCPDTPIAINTPQHLRRVSTQKGCFTVHGHGDQSIDQYFEYGDDFFAIRIKAGNNSKRESMLTTLEAMGIDEAYIYQDLDSLCKKLTRLWVNEENL